MLFPQASGLLLSEVEEVEFLVKSAPDCGEEKKFVAEAWGVPEELKFVEEAVTLAPAAGDMELILWRPHFAAAEFVEGSGTDDFTGVLLTLLLPVLLKLASLAGAEALPPIIAAASLLLFSKIAF